jgi:ATP-dependent Clp endopeptidase proteolytic subunit ClpP
LTGTVRERHAPLRGRVTKQSASCCIARLLVLAAEDPKNPIVAYIDSAGGSAGESLSILSTMNGIRCPIVTFCRGTTGGPAVVIAAHGLRGFRVAAPNTRFSFKDFDFVGRAGKMTGKESFLPLLAEILSEDSHRPKEEFLELLAKGAEFNVQEAIRLGLIDQVSSKPILPPKAA